MENKKILITGASSGLGRELTIWADSLHANLCLLSKSSAKLEALQSSLINPCKLYSVDLENEQELSQALDDIIANNNIPDIIIHCAGGGFKLHNPLLTRSECQKLLAVNLLSAIQINSQLIPKMIEQQHGVVIHIGSTASAASHGSVAYNTAKSALSAYVRSLGRELASQNITVTGISPGGFLAEGNNMFNFKKNNTKEFEAFVSQLPAKALAEASQFIPLIYLLCQQNTPLFSGCMLPVDSGEGMAYAN